MTLAPLLTATDLAGFAGAPFDSTAAIQVGDRIRDACNWHVAPSVTETLTVHGRGSTVLALPTLHLTAVSAVRDVSGTTPVAVTDYRWSPGGFLVKRAGCWPFGPRTVEVDVVHGYAACPAALLEWAAQMLRVSARGSEVRSQASGPFNVAYTPGADEPPIPAGKYQLLPA